MLRCLLHNGPVRAEIWLIAALMDIHGQVLGERLKEIPQIMTTGRVTQKWGHSEELLQGA
jgi:hypothetical protein